jgi:hypothetical protein
MKGDFLQGLSEGIFSRLNELRTQQQANDERQKGETIRLLAGLAGQVEPESIPALMGHLGDVIGIKGKMRKFWDVFSGQPDTSVEQQLGAKLKEITSGMIGPQTAVRARTGADMARLFQPTTPEQQANRERRLQAESDLSNKLVFRDPRAEKLQELEKTYGLKFAQQQGLLDQREELLRQRQHENDERDTLNKAFLQRQAEELRSERAVNARAFILARKDGFLAPTPGHLQQAAEQIASEQGLNVDLLKARIGLTEARIPLVEAQTKKAQRPPKAQKVSVSDAAMGKAVELFERTKQALVDATSRGDQAMMASLRKRLNSMAVNLAGKYPQLEVGGGEWPYVKSRSAQGSGGPALGPALPPTVETLPGGIRLTTPGPTLNERQRAIFDDIKRERPDAADSQILDYMRKKGWLQ